MRAYFLLAFISLFGLATAMVEPVEPVEPADQADQADRTVDEYADNFVENLRADVNQMPASDKADIENLIGNILGLGTNNVKYDIRDVPADDYPLGLIKHIEAKTGKTIDEESVVNVDADYEEHVLKLCEKVSVEISYAMAVFYTDASIYKKYDDEIVPKWLNIGIFCEHIDVLSGFFLREIKRQILGEEAVPTPSDESS